MCVPKETKYIYCKAFNIITNKNDGKIMEILFQVTVSSQHYII